MARIVLNTFGSFGDVHPYLALAIELKLRGHRPVVATAAVYRSKIEEEGIEFAPVRPDVGELHNDPNAVRKFWHPTRGSEYLIRDYLIPQAEASYRDLLPHCHDADLLLTHFAAYAGPMVAQKLNLRWISVVLQPSVFLSAEDPPALPNIPWLPVLRRFGKRPVAGVLRFGRRILKRWAAPLVTLRHKLGLPPSQTIFDFSPYGSLALFSSHFANPQSDWPSGVQVTGFPFYDRRGSIAQSSKEEDHQTELAALERFIEAGPAPVLFTLGSSAVYQAGTFYEESAKAVRRLGLRAILLVGPQNTSVPARHVNTSDLHFASYAPYSMVMPRCLVTVHQGGIGTTAQALRAGRPTVVVPWSHDQPDNAYRIRRLGVGLSIKRKRYAAARVTKVLQVVLNDKGIKERAEALGKQISMENGIATACDAIEERLRT